MEELPKISDVTVCETCRNIPQETPIKKFTGKNSLTREMLLRNVCSNFL